jgi:hypothetical protein
MRASTLIVLALAAAPVVPAWAGGDSGYRPPNGSAPPPANVTPVQAAQPNYMDSCSKTLQMAQANLSKTSAANKPRAEEWIAKATTAQAAGDGWNCVNHAHEALTFEH